MSSPRVFVVTGANKGIGKSIVKLLLQDKEEKIVYLTSRNVENGEKAVQELASLGLKATFYQLDITNSQSIAEFRNFLATKHRGFDVLVNNAGIALSDPTMSLYDKANNTVNCNYFGTLEVCEFLIAIMKENGRVVHVSSMASVMGYRKLSPELKAKFSDPQLTLDGKIFL